MAIQDGFPATGLTLDATEARKDLAGLILRDTSGNPRPGVFPRSTAALVTSKASMAVDVAAFEGVAVRGGGPIFMSNDGTVSVTIGAAPASNSRIDVVYFKQNESASPYSDANNSPILDVVAGVAAPVPSKPTLPTGAVELATVLVPAGVSATNAVGVVITQTFAFTALAGTPIPVRNATELSALTGYAVNTRAVTLDRQIEYRYAGSSWVPALAVQPLKPTSVSAGSGTATINDDGSITLVAAQNVDIAGIGSADFFAHELLWDFTAAAASMAIVVQARAGGSVTATGYSGQKIDVFGSGSVSGSAGITTGLAIGRAGTAGSRGSAKIFGLFQSEPVYCAAASSHDGDNFFSQAGSFLPTTTSFDGLRLLGSAGTLTGKLWIRGLS